VTTCFVIYGYDDEDNAPVLLCTDNRREAAQCARDYGAVVYEYDKVGGRVGGSLCNGRRVWPREGSREE